MIMKNKSLENTRNRERKLCIITLIIKRSFKKRGQQKKKRKHDSLADNKKEQLELFCRKFFRNFLFCDLKFFFLLIVCILVYTT